MPGAEGRGVVHAGTSAGVRIVVAGEAAVAVLRLPVIFVVFVAVPGSLSWWLLWLLDGLRLARLRLWQVWFRLGGRGRAGRVGLGETVPVQSSCAC